MRTVELVLLRAAKRLGVFVVLIFALVAGRFAIDLRVQRFAVASACVAASLLAAALVALAQAGRILRRAAEPAARVASSVYRASARPPELGAERVRAARAAGVAFMLLSLAAATTVVAAAAR